MYCKMAEFTLVLTLLVVGFMLDVGSCTSCEGEDREKILQALLSESHWETLAGFLGVEDGVLEGIWAHCGTQGSVSATCYRRQLVRHYCDKKAQDCRQIAIDMANVLEHNMGNKRLAKRLRQLFDIENDDHEPPPTDSATPSPDSDTDNHQTASQSYGGEPLWVWLTENWFSLSVPVAIIILSSVYRSLKRRYTFEEAKKAKNSKEVCRTNKATKKPSKEPSKKKTVSENTAMDKVLDSNDLSEILELLVDVNKNWKELGLQLGMRAATLDGIEANKGEVKDYRREMMIKWLKWVDIDYKPTWRHLAEALKHTTVQHAPIAQVIEDKVLNSEI